MKCNIQRVIAEVHVDSDLVFEDKERNPSKCVGGGLNVNHDAEEAGCTETDTGNSNKLSECHPLLSSSSSSLSVSSSAAQPATTVPSGCFGITENRQGEGNLETDSGGKSTSRRDTLGLSTSGVGSGKESCVSGGKKTSSAGEKSEGGVASPIQESSTTKNITPPNAGDKIIKPQSNIVTDNQGNLLLSTEEGNKVDFSCSLVTGGDNLLAAVSDCREKTDLLLITESASIEKRTGGEKVNDENECHQVCEHIDAEYFAKENLPPVVESGDDREAATPPSSEKGFKEGAPSHHHHPLGQENIDDTLLIDQDTKTETTCSEEQITSTSSSQESSTNTSQAEECTEISQNIKDEKHEKGTLNQTEVSGDSELRREDFSLSTSLFIEEVKESTMGNNSTKHHHHPHQSHRQGASGCPAPPSLTTVKETKDEEERDMVTMTTGENMTTGETMTTEAVVNDTSLLHCSILENEEKNEEENKSKKEEKGKRKEKDEEEKDNELKICAPFAIEENDSDLEMEREYERLFTTAWAEEEMAEEEKEKEKDDDDEIDGGVMSIRLDKDKNKNELGKEDEKKAEDDKVEEDDDDVLAADGSSPAQQAHHASQILDALIQGTELENGMLSYTYTFYTENSHIWLLCYTHFPSQQGVLASIGDPKTQKSSLSTTKYF